MEALLRQRLTQFVKDPITQVQIVKYAGASGDFNRIHIDEKFALQTPQKGVIAHGMLSMGFLAQYLVKIAGDEFNVKRFKVRFRAMVRPDDQITCEADLKESSEEEWTLEIRAKNQRGETVISGEAVLAKK